MFDSIRYNIVRESMIFLVVLNKATSRLNLREISADLK